MNVAFLIRKLQGGDPILKVRQNFFGCCFVQNAFKIVYKIVAMAFFDPHRKAKHSMSSNVVIFLLLAGTLLGTVPFASGGYYAPVAKRGQLYYAAKEPQLVPGAEKSQLPYEAKEHLSPPRAEERQFVPGAEKLQLVPAAEEDRSYIPVAEDHQYAGVAE